MSENSTRAQIACAISESAAHGMAVARCMLGVGLGVLIVLAPGLSAAAETNPREADEDTSLLQEVVVTGSHFKTLNESSPSPVVVLGSEARYHGGSRFLKVLAMRSGAFGAPGFDLGKLFALGCFLLGKTTLFVLVAASTGAWIIASRFGHRGQRP